MKCPKCGADMRPLWFMDQQPDGWVCDHCADWFSDVGQLLAHVFGAKEEKEDDQTDKVLN